MSDYFLGEIRVFGFNFAPQGWAQCNGQTLPINQNQALFTLLGIRFGGNGSTNFNLPDLRSRVPLGCNTAQSNIGASAGEEAVTLTSGQMPQHQHYVNAVNVQGDSVEPNDGAGNFGIMAQASPGSAAPAPSIYGPGPGTVALAAATLGASGGSPGGASTAHPNIQPYSVMNFCIALSGIFPSRG